MNLNDPRHPWSRLLAAARLAPDDRDTSAPYGFATRAVALALALRSERSMASLLERFSLRAVGVAALLALLSIALNYQHVTKSGGTVAALDREMLPADDAVAIVLDFSAD